MLGLMQDWPLLCHSVLDYAARYHPDRQFVSRSIEGPFHVTTYPEIRARSLRVAQRLAREGIKRGDRVATMAFNTWRHFEAWYGILGIGRCTTPSIRGSSRTRSPGSSITPKIGS